MGYNFRKQLQVLQQFHNKGYFCNTTSAAFTVTLPASPSAGDVVGIKDYANTFDTNKCILNANGNKIQGSTENFEIIC
jgi:hypothetical protein